MTETITEKAPAFVIMYSDTHPFSKIMYASAME